MQLRSAGSARWQAGRQACGLLACSWLASARQVAVGSHSAQVAWRLLGCSCLLQEGLLPESHLQLAGHPAVHWID